MRLTEKVHQRLRESLCDGDVVIDATAGNGHDTVFLAQQVGTSGQVFAIDIQQSAIQATRAKLVAADLEKRVRLYCADHAVQLDRLKEDHAEKISAILFNLGYLPGSDKTIQTQPANTLSALDAALDLLRAGGLLCVTAYRGHPGGMQEAAAVEEWMRRQETIGGRLDCHIPESNNTPPILWILQK